MSVFAQPTWAAWRGLKGLHNKKTIQCKSITNSKEKRLCLDSANAELYQKELGIIKRVISQDCPQNKNEDLCKKKGQNALHNVQTKLLRQMQRSKQRRLKGLYRY
jgi:hypothetical protein